MVDISLLVGGLLTAVGVSMCLYWWVYWERNFEGELLTEGPYAIVRHPYYSGFIFLALGLTITLPILETRLLAVMTLAVLSVYVPREEEQLILHYKQRYKRYMAKVKYRLIPGIY